MCVWRWLHSRVSCLFVPCGLVRALFGIGLVASGFRAGSAGGYYVIIPGGEHLEPIVYRGIRADARELDEILNKFVKREFAFLAAVPATKNRLLSLSVYEDKAPGNFIRT